MALSLELNPHGEVSAPKQAATVILLRERDDVLETYCIVRSLRSGFLGGAVVFPGGKVDQQDRHADWERAIRGEATRASEVAADAGEARALVVAAAREMLEEAGVFPAPLDAAACEALRTRLRAGALLLDLLRDQGIALLAEGLTAFARWVTPEAEQRRFDARFFLLAVPRDQVAKPDDHEAIQGFWASPGEVLDRFARGEIMLAPPTTRCLELLAPLRTIEEAFTLSRQQSLCPICPQFVPGDPPILALPGDPVHPVAEQRVAGPTRFVLRDGRFVSEDAPRADHLPSR